MGMSRIVLSHTALALFEADVHAAEPSDSRVNHCLDLFLLSDITDERQALVRRLPRFVALPCRSSQAAKDVVPTSWPRLQY
jgi:hypothetical protein